MPALGIVPSGTTPTTKDEAKSLHLLLGGDMEPTQPTPAPPQPEVPFDIDLTKAKITDALKGANSAQIFLILRGVAISLGVRL
jgi:hypothetical protein